jgi:hypothetical protein
MNDSPLLLVLTSPGDKNIPLLAELRQMATIVVGDSPQDLAKARTAAEIILGRAVARTENALSDNAVRLSRINCRFGE